MHEIIALRQRIAARDRQPAVEAFALTRVDPRRFLAVDKAPDKAYELRASRPRARRTLERLGPIAERTGSVEKAARRAIRVGKLRLFRLWKRFEYRAQEAFEAQIGTATRPLAERLAWLRRTRRL